MGTAHDRLHRALLVRTLRYRLRHTDWYATAITVMWIILGLAVLIGLLCLR